MVSFDDPEGIDFEDRGQGIDYPDRLDVGTKGQAIEVPDNPVFRVNQATLKVPVDVKVIDCVLMESEEKTLKDVAKALGETSERLQSAHSQMGQVALTLNTRALDSLKKMKTNLEDLDGSLEDLNEAHIPAVIRDLNSQIKNLSQARDVFRAIGGVIPIWGW